MVRNASRRPNLRKISLAAPPDSAIARAEFLGGEDHLAETINNFTNNYLAIVHHVLPKFLDHETLAICDALGEHWQGTLRQIQHLPREILAGLTADLLDTKWGLDADRLKIRLDRMSYTEPARGGRIRPRFLAQTHPQTNSPR